MDGRAGFGRDSKKVIDSYKGQEDVEDHDRLRPEGTLRIKEESPDIK